VKVDLRDAEMQTAVMGGPWEVVGANKIKNGYQHHIAQCAK